MSRRLPPPGGQPPPEVIRLAGAPVALRPLATEVSDAFLTRFPDELERYDDPERVHEWCTHDTQHLIAWAAASAAGRGSPLVKQLNWLGEVLESRGYPAQRLADSLELAARIVEERLGESAATVAAELRAGALHVHATPTFLTVQDRRRPED